MIVSKMYKQDMLNVSINIEKERKQDALING